ncbi:MAG: IS66 family transposase [Planctomycetaceae bacterium]|nr:MAG: IS66 family transposase [Planctomycetaceae bacterium]
MVRVFTRKEVDGMIAEAVAKATAPLLERITALEAELAKAKKNSSNSSKPPSSDMVKPPKPPAKDGKKRKRGAQPGHPQHLRPIFPPEAVKHIEPYTLDRCPDCGGSLRLAKRPPDVLQQIEIAETPTVVTEHRGLAYWCPHCQKFHYAPLPDAVVKAGLFGPRLTALVAFMKGVCHASFSTIRKFLRDVAGVDVSRGYLAKLIAKVSESLAAAYAELFARLPSEAVLNIDETGHKEYREKFWTWCFRAQLYTLFRIDKSRGSKVLIEVLGKEFNGVLGCDYFGAYRKYMRQFDVLVQFCLAHLIRDVKFLLTLPGSEDRAYGQRVRNGLRELFAVIHRRDKLTAAGLQRALEAARQQVLKVATTRVPKGNHAQNLAKRFREHGEAYFRFITTPGIEPTNNLAEQAIRFVVIDRRITLGTRSETGRRWCERIWTVIATCAQQGRSAFKFLLDSIHAYFRGGLSPSLLPSGP